MTDGTYDRPILDIVDRVGLDGRIMRGRESPETLTSLSLAMLWDDPSRNNFDYPCNRRKPMSEPWRHDLPPHADELARLARLHGADEAEAIMRAKYGDDADDDEREE